MVMDCLRRAQRQDGGKWGEATRDFTVKPSAAGGNAATRLKSDGLLKHRKREERTVLQYNHRTVGLMASSSRIHKDSALRTAAQDERSALLQRVMWSRQIEKSVRIRDFLVYVCERAIQDPSAEVHEQEIGCRVFARSADYDTTVDNIVRVTASQARKKLEQYFSSEGAAEPIVLEIPKGQYTPIFRERTQAPVETNSAAEPEVPARFAGYRRAILVLACCAPLFAAGTAWFGWKAYTSRSEMDANPALHGLWSQLLSHGGNTDIVVTDSSLSLFQELLDRQLTLPEYLKPDLWAQATEVSSNPQLQSFAQRAAQRGFTSLGSVTTAYRIAQLAGKDGSQVSIHSPRDFNVRQMRVNNVVLLGSSRANPWVELIADRLNFRFGFDQKSRYSFFENRDPRVGEAKLYPTDSSVSYCHVAFLPNLGKTGNILAIAGTEVEGTEGGGEFVTNERSLVELRNYVRPEADGRMPHFELLLKSNRVGGAAPGFHVVAFRQL
jgi:hypothetical protein